MSWSIKEKHPYVNIELRGRVYPEIVATHTHLGYSVCWGKSWNAWRKSLNWEQFGQSTTIQVEVPYGDRVIIADDLDRAGRVRTLFSSEIDLEMSRSEGRVSGDRKSSPILTWWTCVGYQLPDKDGIEVIPLLKTREYSHSGITVHEDDALLRERPTRSSWHILKQAQIRINFPPSAWCFLCSLQTSKNDPLTSATWTCCRSERTIYVREPHLPAKRKILKLFVQGYTNKQMADVLSISVRTVEDTGKSDDNWNTQPVDLLVMPAQHLI